MVTEDDYAAIGIDPWAARRRSDEADSGVAEAVGRAVLRLRLYWGWSQKELEHRSGVDQTTISRLENGRQRGLSIRRLFRILRALRLGVVELRPRTPAAPPTALELMLHGDPWARATREADRRVKRRVKRRVNRRRSA